MSIMLLQRPELGLSALFPGGYRSLESNILFFSTHKRGQTGQGRARMEETKDEKIVNKV